MIVHERENTTNDTKQQGARALRRSLLFRRGRLRLNHGAKDTFNRFAEAELFVTVQCVPAGKDHDQIIFRHDDRYLPAEPRSRPSQARAVAVRIEPPFQAILDSAGAHLDARRDGSFDPVGGDNLFCFPSAVLQKQVSDLGQVARAGTARLLYPASCSSRCGDDFTLDPLGVLDLGDAQIIRGL